MGYLSLSSRVRLLRPGSEAPGKYYAVVKPEPERCWYVTGIVQECTTRSKHLALRDAASDLREAVFENSSLTPHHDLQ